MKLFKRTKKYFIPVDISHQQSLAGLPLASFRRRAGAFFLDFLIIVLLIGMPSLPKTIREYKQTDELNINIDPFHGWELVSLPIYFGLLTYIGRGQTIGKKIFRIRVVSISHNRLSLWHSIERSLGYGASMLEGGFGFIQYFIHPNRQTVHDRIAETIVIKVEKAKESKKKK